MTHEHFPAILNNVREYEQRLLDDTELYNAISKADLAETNRRLLAFHHDVATSIDECALDALFNICYRPMLSKALNESSIDLYSAIDHHLFNHYILKIESVQWFRRAFWNVNNYGLSLSRKISKNIAPAKGKSLSGSDNPFPKKILFVFKGGYSLAHADVLQTLLKHACANTPLDARIYVLFLDCAGEHYQGATTISFERLRSTKEKLTAFIKLTSELTFYNIVWVACIQNLTLYLGLDRALHNTYWTMKRHSIVFPEVDRYATYYSIYKNKWHEGAFWFGGRNAFEYKVSDLSFADIIRLYKPLQQIDWHSAPIVIGSLARGQKYQSLEYWMGVVSLLEANHSSIFIYGANTDLPSEVHEITMNLSQSHRIINIGWLGGKTHHVAKLISIYLDTIPFGTGVPAAEAILAGASFLGVSTSINTEASLVGAILQTLGRPLDRPLPELGIMSTFAEAVNVADQFIKDPQRRSDLAKKQALVVEKTAGSPDKFAHDYLQYFSS